MDTKLLNELLQLLRKQVLSSGVQLKKQKKNTEAEGNQRLVFTLLIPHKLYVQLKNYMELYTDKGESMTEIILTGLEKELKERYAKSSSRKNQSDVIGKTN